MKMRILPLMLASSFALIGCLEDTVATSAGSDPATQDNPIDSTALSQDGAVSAQLASSSSGTAVDSNFYWSSASGNSAGVIDSSGWVPGDSSAWDGGSSAVDGGASIDGGTSSWVPVDSAGVIDSTQWSGVSSSGTSSPANLSSPIDSLGWGTR